MVRTEREWIDLGKKRIITILQKYIACTQNQLEMKISEAGPFGQCVEPVVLKDTKNELLRAGILDSKKEKQQGINAEHFYYIAGTDGRKLNSRIRKVYSAYSIYDKIAKNNIYCGNVLEYIIQETIYQSEQYNILATKYENTPNGILVSEQYIVNRINKATLTDNRSIDILAVHKGTGIPLGIEIKNKRSWKYGENIEYWECIDKCNILGVLPIFIHRKIPDMAQFTFSDIGMLGMESQFQYFHPCKKEEMKPCIDKEILGYADIKFTVDPLDYMIKYFKVVIPAHINEYYKTFLDNKELLKHYCHEKGLANSSLSDIERTQAFRRFKREFDH